MNLRPRPRDESPFQHLTLPLKRMPVLSSAIPSPRLAAVPSPPSEYFTAPGAISNNPRAIASKMKFQVIGNDRSISRWAGLGRVRQVDFISPPFSASFE